MKRLLLLPLLLGLSSPSMADLGKAEQYQTKEFDIWCGKPQIDCKVTFDANRLRVDNGEGITRDQVLVITYEQLHVHHWFTISYKKGEDNRIGTLIVRHNSQPLESSSQTQFKRQLVRWSGQPIIAVHGR